MSLIGKKPSNTFKDLLYCSNSNSGLTSTPNNILSGNGNASSVYLSTDKLKIQPTTDSTQNTVIYDANGNAIFTVDSSNDAIKAGINQNHITTQYAHFGIIAYDATQFTANTHFAIPFGGVNGGLNYINDVDFGTGTDPDDSFTTANTDSQYAGQIVPMIWIIPDAIVIDSVNHIEGAIQASGDTTRMHLKSYDFTSDSTSALTNGTLLASNADITNDGREQIYSGSWTVSSSSVPAGKAILCFFRSDSVNSDYSISVTIKYHLA
tara:strand:- start:364 stop:1158 length:795 start_codon:yes stop_codon:yes gene_type:complete